MSGCSSKDNFIDRDECELDEESDHAHHDEADRAGVQHFQVLLVIGPCALFHEVGGVAGELTDLLSHCLLFLGFVGATRVRHRKSSSVFS